MYRVGQEEIDAVARAINSGNLFKTAENGETENLEKEFRAYLGSKRTVVMTSGMAALTSALIGMGIGPGDEVIVPAYTYIATALAVLATGAIPVVSEIDETLMIDPDDAEKRITSHTKAIIAVHMMGHAADMDRVMAVAKKHNLMVLEDACQAVGGSYKGKKLGTIGDAGAFSFNFFKNISSGEGGLMITNNQKIFENGLIYHDCCAVSYFGDQLTGFSTPVFGGTEFRTNEITSAILRVQLSRLDGILEDLKKNKKLFKEALSSHFKFVPENDPDGECSSAISLQFDSPEETAELFDRLDTVKFSIPARMGKHVCTAWDIMIEKRGACHPLMNPYNMDANKNAPEFNPNSYEKSMRILSSSGNLVIHPDWDEAEIERRAKILISGLK